MRQDDLIDLEIENKLLEKPLTSLELVKMSKLLNIGVTQYLPSSPEEML